MEITCPQCGKPVPVADVDLKDKIAKCVPCDSIFGCRDQLRAVASKSRQALALPQKLQLEEEPSGLTIRRKWFGAKFIALTVFVVFWDGFMVVWFGIAISQGEAAMALFGSIHGAIGVALTYYTLAGYLNTTVISVSASTLRVRHGPLPVPGNKEGPSSEIDQLYVKEKRHRGKHGSTFTYELRIVSRAGNDVKLLGGLTDSNHALYIEQAVEKYLKIADRPVRGELDR